LSRETSTELPSSLASLRKARELVAEWLPAWSHVELVPVATVVVNVFVANVLQHNACTPVLVLESDGEAVTISGRTIARYRRPAMRILTSAATGCRVWRSSRRFAGRGAAHRCRPERRCGQCSAGKTSFD